MANDAVITWASKDEQIVRTLEKTERGFDLIARRLDQVESKSRTATGAAKSGLEGAAASAVQFSTSLTGVGSAAAGFLTIAETIKNEYDALLAKQRAAAGTQRSAAESLREARKMFVGDKTVGEDQFEQRIRDIAARQNARVEDVAHSAGSAFSAKGDLTNLQALQAVEEATAYSPTDPAQAEMLAGRLLDLQKASGASAAASGGFIASLTRASRVTSMQKAGANLLPAVTGGMAFGDTPEQAAEVVAAINQRLMDDSGERTRTAFLSLASQLRDFLPDEQGTQARLAKLQGDEKLRKKFLTTASFEAAAKPYMEGMISGSPADLAALEAARGSVPALDERQAAVWQAERQRINQGAFQPVAEMARRGESAVQQKQLRDRLGAMTGAAFEEYQRTLENVDLPGPDTLPGPLAPYGSREFRLSAFKGASSGVEAARMAEQDFRFLSEHVAVSGDDKAYLRQAAEEMAHMRQLMEQLLAETQKVADSNKEMADDQKQSGPKLENVVRAAVNARPWVPPEAALGD